MPLRRRLLAFALLTTAALAGCGGDAGVFAGAERRKPNATDAAFVRAMIAHERTIASMAQIGRRKAMRQELRQIARGTLAGHEEDLRELARVAQDLRTRRVSPGGAGIPESPPFDPRGLRNAVSIDHEFLEVMIRQHEYAMTAADAERARGGDNLLKLRAQAIYEASRRDLEKLRRWLRTWYGDDTQPGEPPGPPPGGGGGGGGGKSPGPPV